MYAKGKGKPGRGCCGQCFTPFGCARRVGTTDVCGCHAARGETCRLPACGAGLYVVIPDEPRPEVEGFERELASIVKPKPGRKKAAA